MLDEGSTGSCGTEDIQRSVERKRREDGKRERERTLDGEPKLRSDEREDGSLNGSDERKTSTGGLGSGVAD